MNSDRFIPSSPILSGSLHHHEVDEDEIEEENDEILLPQKKLHLLTPTRKRQQDYPTPNPSSDFPSSSLGLPQSPVKDENYNDDDNNNKNNNNNSSLSSRGNEEDITTSPLKPELVKSPTPQLLQQSSKNDARYKFISPMDNVKIIKLLDQKDGVEYKFGRSSQQNDFQLNKMNKSISKCHFIVKLDLEDYIIIHCLGINGMNLTIPKPSVVKFMGKKDQYLIEPTSETKWLKLNAKGLSKVSRCNQRYDNLTNVMLMRDEVIKIPKMKGILLDIWDEFILLDFENEKKNSKEEEEEVIVKKISNGSDDELAMCYKPDDPLEKNVFPAIITKKEDINNDQGFKKPEKRGRPKSSSVVGQITTPDTNHQHQQQQQHKKIKHTEPLIELYKDISDEEVNERLSQIEDLQSIKNVLINHLAFSRLSSTPISVLQKISKVTSLLSKLDLQLILIKDIKCCGVIYRVGKDAAGKPLEEEYYYQLDLDDDLDRQKLVDDLKGAGGNLRSCRKVHKQYFWKRPKV